MEDSDTMMSSCNFQISAPVSDMGLNRENVEWELSRET